MKICLITSEYITEKTRDGGLARYTHNLAKTLVKSDYNVTIITRSERNFDETKGKLRVIGAKCNPVLVRILSILTAYALTGTVDSLVTAIAIYRVYKKMTKENGKFDAVQAASYHFPGIFIRDRKFVRMSSYEPLWAASNNEETTFDKRLLYKVEDFELKNCYKVYAPSKLLASYARKKLNRQVDQIYPPLPVNDWNHTDNKIYKKYLMGKKYFLFFGSLSKIKGTELLFNSVNEITSRTNAYFVFVGKGTYIRSSNPKVIRFESIKREELQPIIENAEAVVLPSIVDNIPNTCVEAMNSSQIVVATSGSSMDELIENNISGYIIHDRKTDSLIDTLLKIMDLSPDKRRIMKANAKTRIQELLDPDKTRSKLIKYFSV